MREGANRVPMPPRTKYLRGTTLKSRVGDSVRGDCPAAARCANRVSTKRATMARIEPPTTVSPFGTVMIARTEYRQARAEPPRANKVPTITGANRVPTSMTESHIPASLSELLRSAQSTADPSSAYLGAERCDSDALRATCSSRRASESRGVCSSSLQLFTMFGTRDFSSVVTLRSHFVTGGLIGELLGELFTGAPIGLPERIRDVDRGSACEQSTEKREESTDSTRTECRIATKVHARWLGTLFAARKIVLTRG